MARYAPRFITRSGGHHLTQAAVEAEDPLDDGSDGNPSVRVVPLHEDGDGTTTNLADVAFFPVLR
ncbi:hypothetical protein MINTM011_32780 [Mycobacterium paraintracellulare]|nr:hypothetical protein MINTM011_32780 [Mycobacterium paraintracellulare]